MVKIVYEDDRIVSLQVSVPPDSIGKPAATRRKVDGAVMVGRAVAERMEGARIVREKHFDPNEWPKRNLTPEEMDDIES